jgi:hypothetical protein
MSWSCAAAEPSKSDLLSSENHKRVQRPPTLARSWRLSWHDASEDSFLETDVRFVPKLQAEEDTQYFKQRYAFGRAEDAAVVADLEECEAETLPLSGMEHIASVGLAQL